MLTEMNTYYETHPTTRPVVDMLWPATVFPTLLFSASLLSVLFTPMSLIHLVSTQIKKKHAVEALLQVP